MVAGLQPIGFTRLEPEPATNLTERYKMVNITRQDLIKLRTNKEKLLSDIRGDKLLEPYQVEALVEEYLGVLDKVIDDMVPEDPKPFISKNHMLRLKN